jgi:hypothetical protein
MHRLQVPATAIPRRRKDGAKILNSIWFEVESVVIRDLRVIDVTARHDCMGHFRDTASALTQLMPDSCSADRMLPAVKEATNRHCGERERRSIGLTADLKSRRAQRLNNGCLQDNQNRGNGLKW